jgi:hypothetical protein
MVEQAQGERAPFFGVMPWVSSVKLRIISLMPFTPSVEKWLRSVPR